MALNDFPAFVALTGIHEPSAVQQLPDGRFLVIEDEKQHPFSLVTIAPDRSVGSIPLTRAAMDGAASDAFWALDDLEGLTLDPAGFIHAITSHSRDGDGDAKKSREKLVRFRLEGERVVAPQVVGGLKPALMAAHPVLAAAAAIKNVKAEGGLNIESLESSPDGQRLLIGFRSPLLDRRAIIATIENPAAIFDAGELPRISATLESLDLDGNGIRGMSYMPAMGGYLILGGPVSRERVPFQLWFWSGRGGEPARRVSVPGLPGFEHAEGVGPAIVDGQQMIIIVSDDGNREEGRFARFILLRPEQLLIAGEQGASGA